MNSATIDGAKDAAAFLPILYAFAGRIRSVDIRRYEETDSPEVIRELAGSCLGLTAEVLDFLNVVFARFERDGGVCEGETDQEGDPARLIADLAVMARVDLSQRHELLQHVDDGDDRWTLIGQSDRCFRSVYKALLALESGFCGLIGSDPQLEPMPSLRMSVAIRVAYKKFQHEITRRGDPDVATIRHHLRTAGNAMAVMVGRDEYPSMRVGDRSQLRRLQRRVLGWLAENGGDVQDGVRLWQDVVSYAKLLLQINNRAELIEHDLRVVGEAIRQLDAMESARIPLYVKDLRVLWGRAAELDCLIETESWGDIPSWRTAVLAVASALGLDTADPELNALRADAPGHRLMNWGAPLGVTGAIFI